MLNQMKSWDIPSVTSSQESADGVLRSSKPVGRTTNPYGQDRALVSLSARQVKRKGTSDERHLWPAFHHLVSQCRPPVIFGEQVESAIKHMWLDTVQADMEATGYAVGSTSIAACAVGAHHIRKRLWFVGELGNSIDTRSQRTRLGWQRLRRIQTDRHAPGSTN